MSKRCTRCGSFLTDDERFCPNCGENVGQEPPVQGPSGLYSSQPNPNKGEGQPYTGAPAYIPMPSAEEMTVGKWVLTIIVTTFFNIIGLIMLFVWGFGSSGPESRKKYCQAMLIVKLISLVLSIIAAIAFGSLITRLSEWAMEYMRDYDPESYYRYFEEFAAVISIM